MAETSDSSDMGSGLSLLFGLVGVLAAVAMAATAYLSFVAESGDTEQLLSGLALTVALVAGALAILAIHLFE
ncbi:MAG: hypothetical protein V5A55_03130 [Halovenus sp.]